MGGAKQRAKPATIWSVAISGGVISIGSGPAKEQDARESLGMASGTVTP